MAAAGDSNGPTAGDSNGKLPCFTSATMPCFTSAGDSNGPTAQLAEVKQGIVAPPGGSTAPAYPAEQAVPIQTVSKYVSKYLSR